MKELVPHLNWSSWAYPLCLSIKGTIWKPHHSAPECCNVFHNHNTTNLNFHYQMQWNVRWGWTQEQIYLVVIYLTEKYLWLCTCDGMYACVHNGSEGCWDTRTQAGTYWLCLHINIERHGTLSAFPIPLLLKTPGHSPPKLLVGNLLSGGLFCKNLLA